LASLENDNRPLKIRQKRSSPEPILASPLFENGFGAPSLTASSHASSYRANCLWLNI